MKFSKSSIPENALIETENIAQRMNRVREEPGWYAYPNLQIFLQDISSAASDILRIKEIICSLPNLLGLSHRQFLTQLGEPSNLLDFSKNESFEWQSSFFRPDCVMTPQGLKILEMNIDNGSMAMYGGMALKSFYKMQNTLSHYISSSGGVSIEDTLDIEEGLYQYFKKIQDNGKKIYFWDLSIRSEAVRSERDREIAYFKNRGLEIQLVLGNEVLEVPLSKDSYVFRYFAYPHILKPQSPLPDIFSQIPSMILSNGDLGVTSAIYDNKVNLALLWSPSVQSRLSATDIQIIRKYIPETYIVDDNLPTLADRSEWVLKQGIGFQGAQVVMGDECSQTDWESALSEARAKNHFVVQSRMHALNLNVQATDGQNVKTIGQNHVLNMFFVDNKFCGSLFRLASTAKGKIGAIDSNKIIGALPIITKTLTKKT